MQPSFRSWGELVALLGVAAERCGGGAALIHTVGGVVFVKLPACAVGGAVCFDPFGDGIEHVGITVLGPFGVEPDDRVGAKPSAEFREGGDVFVDGFGAVYDELEFIGAGDVFGEWQFPALGAERNPVECATNREGAAGFDVCGLADGVECVGEWG